MVPWEKNPCNPCNLWSKSKHPGGKQECSDLQESVPSVSSVDKKDSWPSVPFVGKKSNTPEASKSAANYKDLRSPQIPCTKNAPREKYSAHSAPSAWDKIRIPREKPLHERSIRFIRWFSPFANGKNSCLSVGKASSPRRQLVATAETTICLRGDNNLSQVRNRFFEPQKTRKRLTGFRQSPQPICLGNLLLKREVVKLVLYTFWRKNK